MTERDEATSNKRTMTTADLPVARRWQHTVRRIEQAMRLPDRLRRPAHLSRWVTLASGLAQAENAPLVPGLRWLPNIQANAPAQAIPWLWRARRPLDFAFLSPSSWLVGRSKTALDLANAPAATATKGTVSTDDLERKRSSSPASPLSRSGPEFPIQRRARKLRISGAAKAAGAANNTVLLRTVVERLPYATPDVRLQHFLAGILHLPLPAVRIFSGPAVDTVVGAFNADAITQGTDILLRQAVLTADPRQAAALLGHELVHVALAGEASAQAPPFTARSAGEEERLAQAGEQSVLQHWQAAVSPRLALPLLATTAPVAAAGAITPPIVKTAPAGRDVTPLAREVPPTVQLTEPQLRQIKDAIYRDLLNRLRTEHERGG